MENCLYISNETFKIDWSIHEDWLAWMHQSVLPFVQNSQNAQWATLVKLLDMDEQDGPTYALQIGIASKADYNRLMEIELPPLMQKAYTKWQDRFLGFRTLMEVLSSQGKGGV